MTVSTKQPTVRRTREPKQHEHVKVGRIRMEPHHNEQLKIGEPLEIAFEGSRAPEVHILDVITLSGSEALWNYVLIWREDA